MMVPGEIEVLEEKSVPVPNMSRGLVWDRTQVYRVSTDMFIARNAQQ
jgi:hypothetical protein